MKNTVIHARVDSTIKDDAEKVLKIIGVSMSQAIDLYLRQIALKKGLPFMLDTEENEMNDVEKLAYIINSTDGKEPSPKDKKIIHLYAKGDIDLETAKFALSRNHV